MHPSAEAAVETAPDRTEITEKLARACRMLAKLGLTHAALGHVSYRIGEDRMLIKGKGAGEAGLRFTTAADIIEVDFDAELVGSSAGTDLRPPSESFLHIGLYRQRPDVMSVVHAHPEHAVLLTICGRPIAPIYGAYGPGARLAAEGVDVYPRSIRIRNHDLGREFAQFMGSRRCALMHGHGVAVVGSGVEDAFVRTVALGELVSMTYRAYAIGQPAPISDDDLADIVAMEDKQQETRGSAGGMAGVLASWRFYAQLTGES